MAYLLASNIILIIALLVVVIRAEAERDRLVKIIAAKDYVEYRKFEEPEKHEDRKKNMFSKREIREYEE